MKNSPEKLYLDLMKKTLSFSLWPEPPLPITTFAYQKSPLRRTAIKALSAAISTVGYIVVEDRGFSAEQRTDGHVWPGYADTMVGMRRLDNLQMCVESVLDDGIDGDLIETGVWRGGSCIFMRAILAAYGDESRRVFVADSFAGLPPPDAERYPADRGEDASGEQFLAISREQVARNFERYGLLDDRVVFLKGWFRDTLPTAPVEKLAILRLDGDLYESTTDALDNLYDKLSPGGYCIIDDYALRTCKEAVDDFRKAHGINDELITIDWTGHYWRKS